MCFGKELIRSANEALEIAQSKAEPVAVYAPDTVDAAAIRKQQGLSLPTRQLRLIVCAR